MKKPTNKQRDSAISHLFQRMDNSERMGYTALDLLENYIIFKDGSKEKFTKFLEKKHKEAKKNEEENLRQENEGADKPNKEDARQRAERIRTKSR